VHRTLDEIRREGLAALRERLGRSGLIQFLQQFELGSGDYAQERRDWVDQTSLDEIKRAAATRPTKQRKPAKTRSRRRS
jgi:hypothetical protein